MATAKKPSFCFQIPFSSPASVLSLRFYEWLQILN